MANLQTVGEPGVPSTNGDWSSMARFFDTMIAKMENRVDTRVDAKVAPFAERVSSVELRVQNIEGMMEREGLTRAQEYEIKRQVGVLAYKYAKLDDKTIHKHFCNIWGGLKDKFNVSRYTQIPRNRYDEAVATVRHYDGTSKDYWMDYIR